MAKIEYDDNYFYFLHDNRNYKESEYYLQNDFLCRYGNDLFATFYPVLLIRDSYTYNIKNSDKSEILLELIKKYRFGSTDEYSIVILKIPKKYFFDDMIRPIWKKEDIDSLDYHNNYYSLPCELIYGVYNKSRDEIIFNENYNENIDFNGRVYNKNLAPYKIAQNNEERQKILNGNRFADKRNEERIGKSYEQLYQEDIKNNTFNSESKSKKIKMLKKIRNLINGNTGDESYSLPANLSCKCFKRIRTRDKK